MSETLGCAVNTFNVGQECTVRIRRGDEPEHKHAGRVTHWFSDEVYVDVDGKTVTFDLSSPDVRYAVRFETVPGGTWGTVVRYVLEPFRAEVTA